MVTFEMRQINEFGEPETQAYTCPDAGGYVYFGHTLGGRQVCEKLSDVGNTLRASSGAALPALIRRERKRQLRAERRDGLR